ncbi:MAG: class F sortase [Jatrophihabitans sp.]|nr:MAG: class F sortase [Jatrophihabitans sp.]
MSTRTGSRDATLVGWVPFACMLAAIALLATSAVMWVLSPNWGLRNPITAPRDIGVVPQSASPVAVEQSAARTVLESPDRIVIPKLHTDAPIVAVGTEPSGALQIPLDPRVTGWWRYGAEPGAAVGSAIIAGHINYAGVEGALARIGTLDPGDRIVVYGLVAGRQQQVQFRVTGVRTYVKKTLPYQEIFDQRSIGRLVVVTCGGPFDASTGNYLDNIVAYAVPVTAADGTPPPPS